jgi:undecaprenyl-diphosphatase
MNMNNTIFYFLYNFAHQNIILDSIIIFLAVYLPYLLILFAFIFLLFHHEVFHSSSPWREFIKKSKEIFFVFISSASAWVLARILKILIHTPRPFDALIGVSSLFAESGFAFPSGHATFYSSLAFSVYFAHKKIGYYFLFSALLIGIARVAGGVHFPIDILGGYILGFLVAYLLKNI